MKHLFIGGPLDGQWVETQESPFYCYHGHDYRYQPVQCKKGSIIFYIPREWSSDDMINALTIGYRSILTRLPMVEVR